MRRLGLLLLLGLASCAKFPAGPPGSNSKRLVVAMTVAGQLKTGVTTGGLPYVYLVAVNFSTDENPTTQGPIPVVVPSGNGIVAGDASHFVLWNPLVSPQYPVYKFRDSTLNEWFQIAVPINYVPTVEGDRRLEFEIDLAQFFTSAEIPTIKSVQLNFLSMNNTNNSGGGRVWDALGDGRDPNQINAPLTIRLNSAQTYNNQNQGSIEPQGDCIDPDLDITDWSVEVRIQ